MAYSAGKTVILLSAFSGLLIANQTIVPAGKTGAPGENTCAECHTSIPNSRNGKLAVDFGTLLTYTPGIKLQVTVRITPALSSYFGVGFQATARLSNNATAGKLEPGVTNTAVQTFNNLEYVNQNAPSGDRTYTFQWTPPATNQGNVTFYVAAVAGPGDNVANALDEVLTAVYTLKPATATIPSGYRNSFVDVPTSTSSASTGISNDGRVVGTYVVGNRTRGFLRQPDLSIVQIDAPGQGDTFPLAVNNSGIVVGQYNDGSGRKKGFYRAVNGTYSTFEVANNDAAITGINDAGELVGFVSSFGQSQGYRINVNLQATDPLTIAPTGLNNNGAFAGVSTPPVQGVAGLYGYITTRENYSTAFGSPCGQNAGAALNVGGPNDSGDAAGGCAKPNPNDGTFINSSFIRLADGRTALLGGDDQGIGPAGAGGINNSGVIAATGRSALGGALRAMVLTQCSATVSSNSISIGNTGGSAVLNVTAANDCRWLAFSDSPWVTFSQPVAGTGSLVVNVQASPSATFRTATLSIGGNTVILTQDAVSCTYTLNPPSILLNAFQSSSSFTVTTPSGCSWTATSANSFITVTGGFSGTGNGIVSFTAATNPGTTLRSGTINVGGAQILINQAGSGSCSYIVTNVTSNFFATGGNGSATVSTGDQCSWSATSGATWITIDGTVRFGTSTISFVVAPNTTGQDRLGSIVIAGSSYGITQAAGNPTTTGLRFIPVTPCRAADTRDGGRPAGFGPPRLAGGASREFNIPTSGCGIPNTAKAYSLNITAVPPSGLSFLTTWPTGVDRPLVSTLNAFNGRIVANAAIVPTGTNGSINIFVSNDSDVVIDINGYFVTPDVSQSLAFYPLPPCRVADTRAGSGKVGEFGAPLIAAGNTRSFTVPNAGCGVPASAQAYSLNVTAVPPGPLSFITVFPAGQTRPLASTLNSFDGQIVPNAAIVPAGTNGAINIFASNDTDMIVDINGYFAPAGQLGALSFYTVTPCRVADTRPEGGKPVPFGTPSIPAGTSRDFPIPSSGCGVPGSALAYSLNLTAVPPSALAFVTTWPTGQSQPTVSTLNSFNGQVVANAALVPSGTNGNISVFASNLTDLVIDINGYFAP